MPSRPAASRPKLFRRAIEANSRNDGAGRVNQGEDSALVRIEGSIRTDRRHPRDRRRHPRRHPDPGRRRRQRADRLADALRRRHHRRPRRNGRGPRARPARRQCRPARARRPPAAGRSSSRRCRKAFPSTSSTTGAGWSAVPSAPSCARWPKPPSWSIVLLLLFLGNWRASLVDRPEPAAGHRHRADRHARSRHVRQSDEPRRPCDRHRHAGRRAGGRRREHRRQSQQGAERACRRR